MKYYDQHHTSLHNKTEYFWYLHSSNTEDQLKARLRSCQVLYQHTGQQTAQVSIHKMQETRQAGKKEKKYKNPLKTCIWVEQINIYLHQPYSATTEAFTSTTYHIYKGHLSTTAPPQYCWFIIYIQPRTSRWHPLDIASCCLYRGKKKFSVSELSIRKQAEECLQSAAKGMWSLCQQMVSKAEHGLLRTCWDFTAYFCAWTLITWKEK